MMESEMDSSPTPLPPKRHPAAPSVLKRLHAGLLPVLIGDPNQQVSADASGCVVALVILCGQQGVGFCSTGDHLLQLIRRLPSYWHHADPNLLSEIERAFNEFVGMVELRLAPRHAVN